MAFSENPNFNWESKVDKLWSTTALIYVNNDPFGITAFHVKLEKLLDTFDQWMYGSNEGTAAYNPQSKQFNCLFICKWNVGEPKIGGRKKGKVKIFIYASSSSSSKQAA